MDLTAARSRLRPQRVLTATIGAVLVLGCATAAAAGNSSTATLAARVVYTGCVAAGTGQLYGVTTSPAAPTACAAGDTRISWNMAGVRGATGAAGATGPAGARGPAGATGARGVAGVTGPAGPAGVDGATVLNGSGAPVAGSGATGDFYIDTATFTIYGPRAAGGGWPGGTSLVGPQGEPGPGTLVPPTFTAGTMTVNPFSGAAFTFPVHQFSVAVTRNPGGGASTFTTVIAVQKAFDAASPLLLRQASARSSSVTLRATDSTGTVLRTYVLPNVNPVMGGFDPGTGVETVQFTNGTVKPTVTQQQASPAPAGFAQRLTTSADATGSAALAGFPAVTLSATGIASGGPEVVVLPAVNLNFLTALGASGQGLTSATVDFRTSAGAPARNVVFGNPVVTAFTDTGVDGTPLLTTVAFGTYRTLVETVGTTVVTCTIGSGGAQEGCS